MGSGGSSNIFEEASKHRSEAKKNKEDLQPKSKPKDPFKGVVISDSELLQMIERIHQMDDDLQTKMDRICEISGMSRKDINHYLDNPNNFQPEQWKFLQSQKEELEEKLYAMKVGEIKKKKALKEKKQMAKERQGKTLGARKGWIDMR